MITVSNSNFGLVRIYRTKSGTTIALTVANPSKLIREILRDRSPAVTQADGLTIDFGKINQPKPAVNNWLVSSLFASWIDSAATCWLTMIKLVWPKSLTRKAQVFDDFTNSIARKATVWPGAYPNALRLSLVLTECSERLSIYRVNPNINKKRTFKWLKTSIFF